MALFKPCQGKQACRENESQCLTCGRGLEEIQWLHDLIDQLASLANEHHYTNIDDYCIYIAAKLNKTIEHRRNPGEERHA